MLPRIAAFLNHRDEMINHDYGDNDLGHERQGAYLSPTLAIDPLEVNHLIVVDVVVAVHQ